MIQKIIHCRTCNCDIDRHDIKPPYLCYDCPSCKGFIFMLGLGHEELERLEQLEQEQFGKV